MVRISIVFASILMLLNGCATYRNDNPERLQTLTQHYAQFDAVLAWEVKTAGTATVIDGVVKNIRYYQMDELEIWVSSLNTEGKEMHRAADFIYSLKENETARFRVELPKVTSGTKLRFIYRYIGNDGGSESGNALKWSQSFESEVPIPPETPRK